MTEYFTIVSIKIKPKRNLGSVDAAEMTRIYNLIASTVGLSVSDRLTENGSVVELSLLRAEGREISDEEGERIRGQLATILEDNSVEIVLPN